MTQAPANTASVFHEGEVALQSRLGVAEQVAPFGQQAIRDFMPDQHRAFFAQLPMLVLGALDAEGRPWASAVFGPPGFAESPDSRRLNVAGDPLLHGELGLQLEAGGKVGLLGLQLETRRRNRMNAVVDVRSPGAMGLRVDQSFGNCPQYIQRRQLQWRESVAPADLQKSRVLSVKARALIEAADTFFIASRTAKMSEDPRSGVDVSHRGGRPGFVGMDETGRLTYPDFPGNRFFNTLGNILLDPRVGLFFADFETGDALFLTGQAKIIWNADRIDAFKGAERLIDIQPEEMIYAAGILPLKGDFIDQWPPLAKTGTWREG